ncbi:rhodanese-like domain-containing protein [Pseudonocardiaceae bacterium YIM PH 21723]|nr:rhodanese-like domain-containing protein [Pseudonocardiaceae bacterium YIM PH 21723]
MTPSSAPTRRPISSGARLFTGGNLRRELLRTSVYLHNGPTPISVRHNCQVIPNVPEINVSELPESPVLLDVREDDEWQAGHAPQAVHIPMGELAGRLDELPEDSHVYVVCRVGGRSARVTAYLNANGWDATNVAGGMMAWDAAGKPMVTDIDGAEAEVL